MNFGRKLKELRQKKSLTQEQFAKAMQVSPQAVSKWENDLSMPDIQLLPEISIFFGVTIDELFDITEEAHFRRIENMICDKRFLTAEDVAYAERILCRHRKENEKDARPVLLLAELYNHVADGYREQAAIWARSFLELEPENKDGHSALRAAEQGSIADWNIANHHKRISYYQEFVKKNPAYARGYLWLLDELIADSRIAEARDVLLHMKAVEDDYRVLLYQGNIEWADGNRKKALDIWKQMEAQYPDRWDAVFSLGDVMVRHGQHEQAICYYKKAMELQEAPRYTDAPMAMAHIYEIQKDYKKAVSCWERVLAILRDEWGYTEGETIEGPLREIERLKTLEFM